MKQFLLSTLVLIIVLAVPASCLYMTSNGSASQAAATQTNLAPTTLETSMPPPILETLSPIIYSEINNAIEGMVTAEPFNNLEHIAGASYQVIGVDLPQDNNLVFRVKTRCECAENGSCCNYQHTFVITIMVLKQIYLNTSFQSIPTPASGKSSTLEVWCFDHANLTKRLSVPWTDVISFFNDQIDGFQLWSRVIVEP